MEKTKISFYIHNPIPDNGVVCEIFGRNMVQTPTHE